MVKKNIILLHAILGFLLSVCSGATVTPEMPESKGMEHEFLASFLKHYEFGPEGRYVHEYHPFVLKKTRESFLCLEQSLREKNMELAGRMIILGYEEQGAPSYYTDFTQPKIDDEAMVKGKTGWSLNLHNRFGFMTGFLLKDVNRLAQNHNLGERQIFEHINPEKLLIFDDKATVFQEHAFGQALPLIMRTKSTLNKLVLKGLPREVLQSLVPFWEILYSGALKVGNSQIAGTQDILFSIEYGRYVLSSTTPLRRCFIGPDITYPIEIFAKQARDVTRNSQAFVKKFVPHLKPIEEEPTVYIFCSFVDGVGKSTMLGNIKNWMKHGSNVNLYEHVDNSSSQLAEIFQFKDKVFIADLPAQLSHFTYKPDGLVYVDVHTELTQEEYRYLDNAVEEQQEELIAQYRSNLEMVRKTMQTEGAHSPTLLTNPQYHFLRNLILLKKDKDNSWVPCAIDGREYLFNMAVDGEYRILLPLGKAKSEGLKNIEADQMLFVEGVRLPLPYTFFINDLVTRLENAGVKRVVVVDFLSMYPRSSRENIRVNYLLQQLSLLESQFDVQRSMYRNFTSGGELLYCLLQAPIYERIVQGLELEALVRWQLFSMIANRREGDLNGYSEEELTRRLRQDVEAARQRDAYVAFKKDLQTKLSYERRQLTELYGKAKSFVNVQLFSMADAYNFYSALQHAMTENVESPLLNRLWEDIGSLRSTGELERLEQGFIEQIEIITSARKKVRVWYKIHETCKSEQILAPFLRLLRMSWLTTILNFFGGLPGTDKPFDLRAPMFPHIPLHLVEGHDGYWYAVEEIYEKFDVSGGQPYYASILARLCGVPANTKMSFMIVENVPCVSVCPNVPTNTGIFDYDCTLSRQKTTYSESAMTKLVRQLQKDSSVNVVTPLIDAYNGLLEFPTWASEQRGILAKMNKKIMANEEQPNGLFALLYPDRFGTGAAPVARPSASMLPIHRSIKNLLVGMPWQEDIIRYGLRMWFTLDMIIKDPEGELVVRNKNADDIAASVTLLEAFIMPKYLGLCFEHNLFPDYGNIELFPSNDYWAHLVQQDY